MNPFVVQPQWGMWIVFYFFLGGIAAGAYVTATLVDMRRNEDNNEVARMGYWIAFPLVILCGLFLIADLDYPDRFWHMLVKSETIHQALDDGWPGNLGSWGLMLQAPLLKTWSPMSVGSWALLVFGACTFLSLLGSLYSFGRLAQLFRFGMLGRAIQYIGCAVGFFVAGYTGVLLTATNQPLWSDSDWIGALFITSAASTGIALISLLVHFREEAPFPSMHRLEQAAKWVLIAEAIVFLIFLMSLGELLVPVWRTWQGKFLILGVALLGLVLPLILHYQFGITSDENNLAAAWLVLLAGFLLRYCLISVPPKLITQGRDAVQANEKPRESLFPPGWPFYYWPKMSPEQDRKPGTHRGADPQNRRDPSEPDQVKPRSKVFK